MINVSALCTDVCPAQGSASANITTHTQRTTESTMKSIFGTLCLAATATAFTSPNSSPQQIRTAADTALFGGGRGGATTLEGKKETVAKVRELLDTSEMIITVPASGIKVSQVQDFRRSLPAGTTVKVVKNKLMSRAIEGTPYETAGAMLQGANMWFFINEDIGGTVKNWNTFCKSSGLLESHKILGGNIEGTNYDANGVTAISKLPSKLELIAKIAGGINAVPTKLARVVKAPGMKVARAIKLAGDEVNGVSQ